MRKLIPVVIVGVVVAGIAAYFTFGSKPERRLVVALFNAPASAALAQLAPEFEKLTGTKISVELLPYADLKTKLEQQFFSGASTYDVIMADCIWIPSFAARGFLGKLDITSDPTYDANDLLPALDDYLGKYPKDGERVGLPFMSNTHMMAYRPSVVQPAAERLGIPLPGDTAETAWTWEQYQQVARDISIALSNSEPRRYGTSLQARAGAWLLYEWYSVLFGFVDDAAARTTGLPRFDRNAAAAMEYYAKLYSAAPREALTWGHEEETSAMCSGLTAMDATSNVELAANLLKPECSRAGGPIAFSYPPKGVSGRGSPDMGGYGLLLPRQSPRAVDATRFILWATSKEVHRRIVLQGGSPIRRSELQDAEILKSQPYLRFYEALIRDSVYRARLPIWPELEDVLSRELTAVMKNEKPASAAANSVEQWVISKHVR